MATIPLRHSITRVSPVRAAICALVGVTAIVHLALGAMTSVMVATQPALVATMGGAAALNVMAALFYCNFGGYVVLGAALYHPALHRFQHVVRWALVAYTAVTILAYFALAAGHYDAFGFADKACEALLIGLLVVEGRRTGR